MSAFAVVKDTAEEGPVHEKSLVQTLRLVNGPATFQSFIRQPMKAELQYPIFHLSPQDNMVYVFWRKNRVTTPEFLNENGGGAGEEVVDATGTKYTIRRCYMTGWCGLRGYTGSSLQRTIRYETDYEDSTEPYSLRQLQGWIAEHYPRTRWFPEEGWNGAADFRRTVFGCKSFEELALLLCCRPEDEPNAWRDIARFLLLSAVVALILWGLALIT